jgi:hypothetical protein
MHEAAAAASIWQDLPLKELSWSTLNVPAAVLQQVGVLTGLIKLSLLNFKSRIARGLQVKPCQVTATLQQLQTLRHLIIAMPDRFSLHCGCERGDEGAEGAPGSSAAAVNVAVDCLHDVEGVCALLQAVGELRMLDDSYARRV